MRSDFRLLWMVMMPTRLLRQAHNPLIDNAEEFGTFLTMDFPVEMLPLKGFFGDNYMREELGLIQGMIGNPSDSDDDEDQSARDHDDASLLDSRMIRSSSSTCGCGYI
ncbi:hypothetical protein B0H13DRAFT_2326274 [Mycena leptocephala]|nr:hypothetical protein B0H13DRAFT_2326274 [Mycena leptocephala]